MDRIVKTLFPEHQRYGYPVNTTEYTEHIPIITEEEIIEIAKKIGDRKAPGPDYIPNKALKLAVTGRPKILTHLMNV